MNLLIISAISSAVGATIGALVSGLLIIFNERKKQQRQEEKYKRWEEIAKAPQNSPPDAKFDNLEFKLIRDGMVAIADDLKTVSICHH